MVEASCKRKFSNSFDRCFIVRREVWEVFIMADAMVEVLSTDIDVSGSLCFDFFLKNGDVVTAARIGISTNNIWRVKTYF